MWFYIIFVFYLIFIYYLQYKIKKRRQKKHKFDPFNKYQMVCLIRKKDGSTFERPHKRFEYIGQITEEGRIIGIYTRYQKSKKELEYEKLCEKWR